MARPPTTNRSPQPQQRGRAATQAKKPTNQPHENNNENQPCAIACRIRRTPVRQPRRWTPIGLLTQPAESAAGDPRWCTQRAPQPPVGAEFSSNSARGSIARRARPTGVGTPASVGEWVGRCVRSIRVMKKWPSRKFQPGCVHSFVRSFVLSFVDRPDAHA